MPDTAEIQTASVEDQMQFLERWLDETGEGGADHEREALKGDLVEQIEAAMKTLRQLIN